MRYRVIGYGGLFIAVLAIAMHQISQKKTWLDNIHQVPCNTGQPSSGRWLDYHELQQIMSGTCRDQLLAVVFNQSKEKVQVIRFNDQ